MKTKRTFLAASIIGVLGLGAIAILYARDFKVDKPNEDLTQNQTEAADESNDLTDQPKEETPVQEASVAEPPPFPLDESAILPTVAFVETSLEPSAPLGSNPPIIDPAVRPVAAEVGLHELPDAPADEASVPIPLINPALDVSSNVPADESIELGFLPENDSLEPMTMAPIAPAAFNDGPDPGGPPPLERSPLLPLQPLLTPELTQETSLQDVPSGTGEMIAPLGNPTGTPGTTLDDASSGLLDTPSPVEEPAETPTIQEPSELPPLVGNPIPGDPGGIPGYVPPVGGLPGMLPPPLSPPGTLPLTGEPLVGNDGMGMPGTLGSPYQLPPSGVSTPLAGTPSTGAVGSGLPGNQSEDGLQIPQLQIEKISPEDARIGVPAVFKTVVRNVGNVPAQAVEIWDMTPQGSRLVSTDPPISGNGPHQELIWELGLIQPNEEKTVEMTIMPLEEGEIGSVATVRFAAVASARTIVTRPMLEIALSAPQTVPIGGEATIGITLSNPGSGPTTGIFLEMAVSEGLTHPAGREIVNAFGDLAPGESKQLQLTMQCTRPGEFINQLSARADANLQTQGECRFEVVAPQLELAVEGARTRFLEQNAEYQLVFTNTGTAPARDVRLTAYLPQGLQYVGTDETSQGYYDADEHAVLWLLQELPAGRQAIVSLQTLPIQAGEGSLRFVGSEATGLSAEKEHPVVVDGIPAISYQVNDSRDPVEIGGETTYEIRVENEGTKASTNVQITVQMPPQLEVASIEGPVAHRNDASSVSFDPLPRLEAKTSAIYTIVARGVQAGEARFRVQVLSDESQLPITAEESTRIFADE